MDGGEARGDYAVAPRSRRPSASLRRYPRRFAPWRRARRADGGDAAQEAAQGDLQHADVVAQDIAAALESFDIVEGEAPAALAFRWQGDPLHSRLHELAFGITKGFSRTIAAKAPLILLMDGDIGRTLGEILRRELNVAGDVISVDGVQLRAFDYVDIGELIEPTHVVPLIIKSLLFSTGDSD